MEKDKSLQDNEQPQAEPEPEVSQRRGPPLWNEGDDRFSGIMEIPEEADPVIMSGMTGGYRPRINGGHTNRSVNRRRKGGK